MKNQIEPNLLAVADTSLDSGLPDGDVLLRYADVVTGTDEASVLEVIESVVNIMGEGALVQAAAIAITISMNDRAANATGIVMEPMFLSDSGDTAVDRQSLGIDNYASARNSIR